MYQSYRDFSADLTQSVKFSIDFSIPQPPAANPAYKRKALLPAREKGFL